MKKTRFTEAQIMGVLRQMEGGVPATELCREHGMSSATLYKWRVKYGGMDARAEGGAENLHERTCGSADRGEIDDQKHRGVAYSRVGLWDPARTRLRLAIIVAPSAGSTQGPVERLGDAQGQGVCASWRCLFVDARMLVYR